MRIGFFGDSLTSGVPGSSYVAMLCERFPDDTLLNFGKPNDTVVSLHRRISVMQFDKPLDLAFLWIGVNDVPQTDRWSYRAFHALLGQRRARDLDEFRSCFRATLELVCDRAEARDRGAACLKGRGSGEPVESPPGGPGGVDQGASRQAATGPNSWTCGRPLPGSWRQGPGRILFPGTHFVS